MNLLDYLALALKASFLSTGGLGNVPILHEDLVSRGWATNAMFAEALAVGQFSPGPNGLWAISLGYLLAGPLGAVVALVAVLLPPLTVLGIELLYRQVQHHPAVEGFVRGLSIGVISVFSVVLVDLVGSVGATPMHVGVAIAAFGLAATKRVSVPWIVLGAAALGMLFER